jgi:hypothetical protein
MSGAETSSAPHFDSFGVRSGCRPPEHEIAKGENTMKVWKSLAGLTAAVGLMALIGCGNKEEPTAAAPAGGGTAAPPPGLAEQIRNNPQIPADQRAKYGGGGAAPTGR